VQDSKFCENIDTLLLAVICGEVTGFDEGGSGQVNGCKDLQRR